MKTNLIKATLLLASLAAFSACSGNKGNSNNRNDDNNKLLGVGPQDGRISAFGSDSTYCDFSGGSVTCSSRDLTTSVTIPTQSSSIIDDTIL